MRVARRGWVTDPRTYGILRIRVHGAYAGGLLFRKVPICSCPHPCRLSLFVSPILSRARSVEADCLILEIQLKLHHRFGFPCSPFLDLVCNPDHSLKDFLPNVLCPATRVTSSTRNILILQATLLVIAKSGFLLPHVDMRSNSLHRKNIIGGLSVRNFRNYSSRAFSPR